jgi:hypothetical protein
MPFQFRNNVILDAVHTVPRTSFPAKVFKYLKAGIIVNRSNIPGSGYSVSPTFQSYFYNELSHFPPAAIEVAIG